MTPVSTPPCSPGGQAWWGWPAARWSSVSRCFPPRGSLVGTDWPRARLWQWGAGVGGGACDGRLHRRLSFSWGTRLFGGGWRGTERWDKGMIARAPIGALARRGGAGGLRVVRRRCTSPSFCGSFFFVSMRPPLTWRSRGRRGQVRPTTAVSRSRKQRVSNHDTQPPPPWPHRRLPSLAPPGVPRPLPGAGLTPARAAPPPTAGPPAGWRGW